MCFRDPLLCKVDFFRFLAYSNFQSNFVRWFTVYFFCYVGKIGTCLIYYLGQVFLYRVLCSDGEFLWPK